MLNNNCSIKHQEIIFCIFVRFKNKICFIQVFKFKSQLLYHKNLLSLNTSHKSSVCRRVYTSDMCSARFGEILFWPTKTIIPVHQQMITNVNSSKLLYFHSLTKLVKLKSLLPQYVPQSGNAKCATFLFCVLRLRN